MAAGAIDRIYVHSPDRLARRYAYQVLLIEEVRRAGVEIVFLNRPIGGSAEDDLLLQVQGMIAEYERARILERSRRGRRHAARSGSVSALCAAPFGYRYVGKVAGGGMARFEVIDDEARIVRRIFAWVGLERVSLHEVCRRLAETGCRTRTGLARWDPTTVCGMLRNPAYIGRAAFGRSRFVPPRGRLRPIRGRPWPSRKANTRIPVAREEWIEVPVPALVEPALFAAAQAQLDENRRHRREGRRRPGWLLQGLVVCRRCGYAFYGKMARGKVGGGKKAEYGYYRCLGTDGHRFGGVAPCTNRSVRSDCLELAVWAEIRALLEDPSRLAAEYQRRLDELQQGTGDRNQAATLDHSIEGLHRGIGRLIDSYAEGVIDRDEFQPRIAGLKERLARMKEQRQALAEAAEAERSLALVIGRVEDFAAKVHCSLDELDWQATRKIVRVLVRRIEGSARPDHLLARRGQAGCRRGSTAALSRAVEQLGRSVEVVNEGGSYAIRIRAESRDPELSARIANTLAEVYLESQQAQQFTARKAASDWLAAQLRELRGRRSRPTTRWSSTGRRTSWAGPTGRA